MIADALHSQIDTHSLYGGVVPELASRDHVRFLVKLVDDALRQADLSKQDIDGVAYTAGPGLVGALLTGACFAKSLAFSLNKPAIAVHHLEAHILAAQLDNPQLDFPFLVLLVSGGPTQLLQATALGEYLLLGETLDDAVGEAFDKTAKLMGFPYPGGALLAQLADKCLVDARQMLPRFPRPMLDRPGLDFSFSGLKTHALTTWNNSEKNDLSKKAIAYAFQEAVVETLVTKSLRAIEQSGIKTLVVAGGVAANLTQQITKAGGSLYFPRLQFCTDNGAMIAYAGFLRFQSGQMDNTLAIEVKARWPL